MDIAASQMFSFYSNLLSPESKYLWNKILSKQMESNPYVNLQDDTLEGPRGNVMQVVSRVRDVSPSHRVPHQ
jgi:hypothetical protein